MKQQIFSVEEATIGGVHAAMVAGKLTARRLVETYLKRIEAYDKQGPALNAVVCINEKALEEADRLDRQFERVGFVGPLHGVPVLLKDNIFTADMQTTGGSLSLEGFVPPCDAVVTQKLREAGAIILAKVNLHEFAIWGETISSICGQTLNPYDLTRAPGGSSGGTGAGLAANYGLVGLGTDTVNSIRSPASANSIVGLRPTMGLISREGIIPYSLTQDTVGPMARTVTDAATVLNVLVGYDSSDPVTAWSVGNYPKNFLSFLNPDGLRGVRLGVMRSLFGDQEEHREVNAAMEACLAVMEEQGASLVSIEDPIIDINQLLSEVSVHLYDLRQHLNDFLEKYGATVPLHSLEEIISTGKFHQGIWKVLLKAVQLTHEDPAYNKRLVRQTDLRVKVLEIMADYELDGLVYPHQRRLVMPVGKSLIERNGVLAATTGFPAITLPGGFSRPTASAPVGVPIGIELLGRPWTERKLIKMAYSLEQATLYRQPPKSTPPL
ncbi:MAG: amidase family protein [Negativicutes bacterium]|nr:amidase family protein [Negativicutes bacterium]